MRYKLATYFILVFSFTLVMAPNANSNPIALNVSSNPWDSCNVSGFTISGFSGAAAPSLISDAQVFGSAAGTADCQNYIQHYDSTMVSEASSSIRSFSFYILGNYDGVNTTCDVSTFVNNRLWLSDTTHFEAVANGSASYASQRWDKLSFSASEKSAFQALLHWGTNSISVTYHCGNYTQVELDLNANIKVIESSFDLFDGVSINDGAEFTNSRKVSINLSFGPKVANTYESGVLGEYMISNDGGFSRTQRKILSYERNTVSWTLSASQDERMAKTIYVKYRLVDPYTGQLESNWSQTMSDDIILDTVAPVVSQVVAKSSFSLLPTMNFTRDLRTSASRSIKLSLKASDNRSGVKKVQISGAKSSTGAITQIYAKYITVKNLGSKKHIYVRVRDGAGNWSSWKSVKVS